MFEDWKEEAGREFQVLEVMGTNVLANELVQHLSNSTRWESANLVLRSKQDLGAITDLNLSIK